jgi:hypothetical protein
MVNKMEEIIFCQSLKFAPLMNVVFNSVIIIDTINTNTLDVSFVCIVLIADTTSVVIAAAINNDCQSSDCKNSIVIPFH